MWGRIYQYKQKSRPTNVANKSPKSNLTPKKNKKANNTTQKTVLKLGKKQKVGFEYLIKQFSAIKCGDFTPF